MPVFEKCCVCHTQIFKIDDNISLDDDAATCDVCGNRACGECISYMGDAFYYLEVFNFLSYMEGYSHKMPFSWCITCLSKKEVEMVSLIPHTDLPLLINFKWLSEAGTQAYKAAISCT